MDDDLGKEIEQIEQCLDADDPAFLRRFDAVCRADLANVIIVFTLLAVGVVCLTVGLATTSWPAWALGLIAFAACFAVDGHHKQTLRRTPD
ncbi:MAG TPA: DUF3040 domain-containing protein [Acidimicrobiales bacterium]|nr:DUF3040 domain-containing protein [Acidimicrobiales bacterium]